MSKDLAKAIKKERNFLMADIYYSRGRTTEEDKGNVDKAIELYEKVIKHYSIGGGHGVASPKLADIYYSKGKTAKREGDIDKALELYKKALKYFPKHELSQKAI